MKRLLTCKRMAFILLVATIITLGFYVYMVARPISYGMPYCVEIEYDGETFEGSMTFKPDTTLLYRNTNFDGEMKSRYYYKNGYLFFVMAQTDKEYEEEVEIINESLENSVIEPLGAYKISAFTLGMSDDDGGEFVYTCTGATLFAWIGGAFELILVALTCVAAALSLKSKKEKEE